MANCALLIMCFHPKFASFQFCQSLVKFGFYFILPLSFGGFCFAWNFSAHIQILEVNWKSWFRHISDNNVFGMLETRQPPKHNLMSTWKSQCNYLIISFYNGSAEDIFRCEFRVFFSVIRALLSFEPLNIAAGKRMRWKCICQPPTAFILFPVNYYATKDRNGWLFVFRLVPDEE